MMFPNFYGFPDMRNSAPNRYVNDETDQYTKLLQDLNENNIKTLVLLS